MARELSDLVIDARMENRMIAAQRKETSLKYRDVLADPIDWCTDNLMPWDRIMETDLSGMKERSPLRSSNDHHFACCFGSRLRSSRYRLRSRSIQLSRSEAAFSSSSLFSNPRRSASKNARVRTLYASLS